MTATIAEIAQSFARAGFVAVPNLFSRDEVKVFKAGIQKIVEEVRQEQAGEDNPKAMLDTTGVYVGLAGPNAPSSKASPSPASMADSASFELHWHGPF